MVPHDYVIFDVDDVIVDMDRLAKVGGQACLAPLVAALGPDQGTAVHTDFLGGYDCLRTQLRSPSGHTHPPAVELRADIERWQRGVLAAGHELKIWSRQTLLAVALEKHGVPVTGDLVHRVVDDTYWRTIREQSQPLEDAGEVVRNLRAAGKAVHLATNSDGFLRFDGAAETFVYDPDHAVAEKQRRLVCLRDIGIQPHDISVGDPIGKPDRRFFEAVQRAFEAKLGRPIDLRRTLAVGDSLTNDVEPLLAMGAAHGAWLLRSTELPTPAWLDPDAPRVARLRRLTELAEVRWTGLADA